MNPIGSQVLPFSYFLSSSSLFNSHYRPYGKHLLYFIPIHLFNPVRKKLCFFLFYVRGHWGWQSLGNLLNICW